MFLERFLPRGRAIQLLTYFVKSCTAYNAACLHEGEKCTCDSDLACQTLKLTMMSWRMAGDRRLMLYQIDPVDAADRLAKPELAEIFYLHHERQESEQRPAKRAFGVGLVFQ